ncbi:MAG: 2-C-methyl-D-erythritol 4-phosphate cytidylyltransferase [Desulfobacteraceae bacterium]|nr:2-C-methyl-D-erythritol 4-phosphate cytidylyltransferase [Desulfobacteraceae bacterium]
MKIAIIVAGGAGLRMKTPLRKQYLLLNGVPILAMTLQAFAESGLFSRIHVVVPSEDIEFCKTKILPLSISGHEEKKIPVQFVSGGKNRQDSVCNGIMSIENRDSLVVVHDGVRPFITQSKISDCIKAAEKHGAACLGLPIQDTLKKVDSNGCILETLERHSTWYTQTPQTFTYSLLRKAHEKARKEGFLGTDDACLVERMGVRVIMVEGDKLNIKITTREDMILAEMISANLGGSNLLKNLLSRQEKS